MPSGVAEDWVPSSRDKRDHACVVELRAACIPIIGWLAHHHWFVIGRSGCCDRWEVWQFACAGGTAWGHLHRNLMPAERGVGNGPSRILHEWIDTQANELAALIESSPLTYPYRDRYLPWPGPNSNSYVQWILGNRFSLGPKAVGRAFAVRETTSLAERGNGDA